MLKVWWVYAGYQYYPERSLGNLQKTFTQKKSAQAFVRRLKKENKMNFDWFEIHDITEHLMDN